MTQAGMENQEKLREAEIKHEKASQNFEELERKGEDMKMQIEEVTDKNRSLEGKLQRKAEEYQVR